MTDQLPLDDAPPIDAAALPEEPPSRWPKVIGIISLIYAICGLLCALGISLSSFLTSFMMSIAGMHVQMPTVLSITNAFSGVVLLVLGFVMLSGAIATLRRKRSGPKTLKVWVILRLTMIAIGLMIAVLTAPAQIQFQQSMLKAQQDKLRESGSKVVIPDRTDDQIWHNVIIGIAIGSAVFAAYPLFLGFYLARQKITDDVQRWV